MTTSRKDFYYYADLAEEAARKAGTRASPHQGTYNPEAEALAHVAEVYAILATAAPKPMREETR